MLKHRIIPVLLFNQQLQVVQTTQFKRPYRNCGSLMQHIEVMESRDVDEIILLDIDATKENREPNFEVIKEFASRLFCPVTYGGGISEINDISKLIQECGVDKVAIKTNHRLIHGASLKFGSQSIIMCLDCGDNTLETTINCDAHWYKNEGAGEILVTSIHCNGTYKGYDLYLLEEITNLNIPVIINGGCGEPSHMIEAIKAGVSAVAASTMFLHTAHTPKSCARALYEAGVPVRVGG